MDTTLTQQTTSSVAAIAASVRDRLTNEYGNGPYWSIGLCMTAAERLAAELKRQGFPADCRNGAYTACERTYPDFVRKFGRDGLHASLVDYDWTTWNGHWQHWWVLTWNPVPFGYSRILVDITADQFHPSNPEPHQIIITKPSDPRYLVSWIYAQPAVRAKPIAAKTLA